MDQAAKEQMSFLTLPPEIRNKIYSFTLVAPSPIVVWFAGYSAGGFPRRTKPRCLTFDREAMASSLRDLALGLLRCNRGVTVEATGIFYGQNTFSFSGAHYYLAIISWLDGIGENNRRHLVNLAFNVWTPSRAWQRRDGTRQRLHNTSSNEWFPRNPHLAPPSVPCKEGEVDNINPAIETIFSIFGRTEGGLKLTLHLDLGFDTLPGIVFITEREGAELDHFSMDLPNLIEKWRADYTSDSGCRPIEVLWKAESHMEPFIEKRGLVEEQGWEILHEEEGTKLRLVNWQTKEYSPYSTIRFTIRRKELTGPIVAADPNPYIWQTSLEDYGIEVN